MIYIAYYIQKLIKCENIYNFDFKNAKKTLTSTSPPSPSSWLVVND